MADVHHKVPDWAYNAMFKIQETHGVNEYTHDCQLEFLFKHRQVLFNRCSSFIDVMSGARVDQWTHSQKRISENTFSDMRPCQSYTAPSYPSPRPLLINAAGTDCAGFSPRGGHAGDGHPSCRTYNIWLVERLALAEPVSYTHLRAHETGAYL
eukprot:52586-Pyramimonas_sp.AAC.1